MRFKYPRVSEILSPYSAIHFSQIDKEVLNNAAERGRLLHSFATAYAREDFLPCVPPEIAPYLESFIAWYDENVESLVASEQRLYNEDLEFCGRPDLVVRLKGEDTLTLIDIKTSAQIYQTYPVQLAAYMDLCGLANLTCEKALLVRLPKNGKSARVKDYGDCNKYFKIFLQARSLYKYFLKK